MAIQNFNQVVDALNQFSNAHLSLKRFKTSFFEQIDNFATAENSFPILYVVPGDVSFENEIDVMSFRVYCVDILQKDRSNEQPILNETLLVLRDLVNWIRMTDTLDLNVVGTPRAVPINNFLTEFTVGFYIDLAVETSPETNDCSIPFSSNFQYSGITCDYTYVSQFLTCDTVASCQSIINIQNQIDAITGGTAGTDYYVTGGTYSNGTLTLNRQNGSVTIPGFLTGNTGTGVDTYVTGFTYNDANKLTISQNQGQAPLNVFINTFTGITTHYVNINTNVTETSAVGRLNWNDTDGTLDLGLKGGNVTLQIGQEQVVRVVNKTATNITLLEANYQAVRITGAQGQRLKVDLAQANNDPSSVDTIGLVTETILNNQEGFITTSGLVRGINTTGSLQSETWVDGDVVYLSPTVAGNITNIKPIGPQHTVIIGYVVRAHITQGTIFVKVDNGYELGELHNVRISGETNNQVLSYDSTQDVWLNRTLPNFITGFTDTYVTGFTYSNNNLTISTNQGQSPLDVTINNFTGLTINGSLSASTYLGLPSNIYETSTDGAVTSASTSNVYTSGVLVPANSFTTGNNAEVTVRGRKTGTAGNMTMRIYVNTINSISGSPILVATNTTAAVNQTYLQLQRFLSIKSTGTTEVFSNTGGSNIDWLGSNLGVNQLSVNWANDLYIVVSTQCTVGTDSINARSSFIKIRR